MPFSVGIGDVIATSKLIKDIIDCLRSAGGARSEYQELVTELDALKIALDDLSQLSSSATPSALLDTIKSCRKRLDEFWAKIKPYEPSLGSSSRSNALRGTKDKLLWTFCQKEEIVQLQRNLQFYSRLINMHLLRHVAEQMQDTRKDRDAVCRQIAERILDTQGTLADVGKEVSSQGVVASNIQSLVTGLHQFIFGEVRSFLADFGHFANNILYVYSLHVSQWSYPLINKHKVPQPSKYMPWFSKSGIQEEQYTPAGRSFKTLSSSKMRLDTNSRYHQSLILIYWNIAFVIVSKRVPPPKMLRWAIMSFSDRKKGHQSSHQLLNCYQEHPL